MKANIKLIAAFLMIAAVKYAPGQLPNLNRAQFFEAGLSEIASCIETAPQDAQALGTDIQSRFKIINDMIENECRQIADPLFDRGHDQGRNRQLMLDFLARASASIAISEERDNILEGLAQAIKELACYAGVSPDQNDIRKWVDGVTGF